MDLKLTGKISNARLRKFIREVVDSRLEYYNVQLEKMRREIQRLEEINKVLNVKRR